MKIIEFEKNYTKAIYDFVMDIKVNELGWKSDAVDLYDIPKNYLAGDGNFWFALEGDKVIGTIGLENKENHQGYLKRMYVAKSYRGTGLAKDLFAIALEFAGSRNINEIFLATTLKAERAIAFYKKSGFKTVDNLPAGFDHFNDSCFMKLSINN